MLHECHAGMRTVVAGLDAEALNWRPAEDANSIAALVAHPLDAERFLVAAVAGIELDRDREAQFRITAGDAGELASLIDGLEAEVDGYLDRIRPEALAELVTPPNRASRPGIGWLLHVTSHSREHVGQALLTRQLWERRG